MTAEEWRPIPGYPEYSVSSLGRVSSARLWRGGRGPRVLRPGLGGNGYFTVVLSGHGVSRRSFTLHDLVTLAFIGPRTDGMEVRHLDGDKTNNRRENLKYGTPSENNYDRVRHGTHPKSSATHCQYGHEWDEANTIVYTSRPGRVCRACIRRRARERRARLRLSDAAA